MEMLAVDVALGSPPRVGQPRRLFTFDERELHLACSPVRCYDVDPDGERFFGTQAVDAPPVPEVTHVELVLNWFEELRTRVVAPQ